MALRIDILKKAEGVIIICAHGSIDSVTYTELEQQLIPLLVASTKVLLLNMENVKYISSMGISVILKSKKTIEERGGSFLMTNLQPQIKMTLEILKNLPNMRVFEDMREADRYLAEIQRKEIQKQKGDIED